MTTIRLRFPGFPQLRVSGVDSIEFEAGITPEEVLNQHLFDLPEAEVLAAKFNNKIIDLYVPLKESGDLDFVRPNTPEGLDVLRHSSAHLMAHAVLRVFKDVEFAIGPTIEEGFYYDFDLDHKFAPEDFALLEAEMKKIVEENIPIRRFEYSKAEAREMLKKQRAHFKLELLEELGENNVFSFYQQGDFTDWCRGPHVNRTGKLKAFKLLSVAGSYWRGDERREMLQRIYATAFPSQEEVDKFVYVREEAKKRDHRKLGKELALFSFQPEGPGFPFWHPAGVTLLKELQHYLDGILFQHDYQEVITPMVLNQVLWQKSGHWDHYRANMYFTKVDEEDFAVKPMNCPGACLIFRNETRSFRDLPLRLAEWGRVHRHEKKGVLSGLQRVRVFTQDDAHVYCMPEQIESEIGDMMRMLDEIYKKFEFSYSIALSTRPPNSIGSDEIWQHAEGALKRALENHKADYKINPGEGAFYGPKLEFHLKDCLGRSWQCGTIQVDMAMPERFDLAYVGSDNQPHRPVMLHRALLGSLERFTSILIENFGGAFPMWLAPEQVRVIPISSEKHLDYARVVYEKLREQCIRATLVTRSQSLNYEIRQGQVQKVSYLLVIGEREKTNNQVAVRSHEMGDLKAMSLDQFIAGAGAEIRSRSLHSGFKK